MFAASYLLLLGLLLLESLVLGYVLRETVHEALSRQRGHSPSADKPVPLAAGSKREALLRYLPSAD